MLNGDGLRVVLGWPAADTPVPGCATTITWDAEGGLLFDRGSKG